MLFNEFDPAKVRKPRGPDIAIPDAVDGLGAAISTSMRDSNANFLRQREVIAERDTLARSSAKALGVDTMRGLLEERNRKAAEIGVPVIKIPTDPADMVDAIGPNGSSRVIEMAREAQKQNPEGWRGVDLSDDGVEARVTERRTAQDQEETDIMSMMPSGSGITRIVGEITGSLADVRNLPFMIAGGGSGSFLKIMGREAALNMAAEGITLPSRYAVADELNKPDPNIAETLAFAAIGGAAFGAAFEGIARGVHYFKGRSALPKSFADNPVLAEDAISAAEKAMHAGTNPLEAVIAVMRDAPEQREPLIPPDKQPGPVVGGVDPIETLPIRNGDQPMEVGTIQKMADAAIKEVGDTKDKKPLTQWFRKSGKPTKAQIAKAEREGRPAPSETQSRQIHPDGAVAAELRAQDITPRSHPGLFSRRGMKDVDGIPAADMEADFPGIMAATRTEYGADYLDRQGLVDLLIRDANGDSSWLRTRQDAEAIQKAADDEIRAIENGTWTAVDDFVAGKKADEGFFVDLNAYHFEADGDARIETDFDAYLADKGFTLLPRERAEILGELQARGGDAEYLVERALEREISDEERLYLHGEPSDGKDPWADGGGAQAGDPGPRPEGDGQSQGNAGNAAADGARLGEPYSFERTQAGQQAVTPGVAPITTRDRLEAAQGAPIGRGGAREPDSQIGGLFDPNDKARSDMFDDPAGPKAEPIQTQISNDFRDMIDEGNDFPVGVEDADGNWSGLTKADGTPLRTASAALDYLDEGDNFSARIDLCGKGPA